MKKVECKGVGDNDRFFEIESNKCDREGCDNTATMKPIVQMRSAPLLTAEEIMIDLKVCDKCAIQKNADDLIDGANAKAMFQDIFKVQTQGKAVDWSCSGVVWVQLQ